MKRKAEAFAMAFWLVAWCAAIWSAGKYWLIAYVAGAALMFLFFLEESHRHAKKEEETINQEEQQKLHEFIG